METDNKFIIKDIYTNLENFAIPFSEPREIYYVTFNRCETKEDVKMINEFIQYLYSDKFLAKEHKNRDELIVAVDPELYFKQPILDGDALSTEEMLERNIEAENNNNPDDQMLVDIAESADNTYITEASMNMIKMATRIFVIQTTLGPNKYAMAVNDLAALAIEEAIDSKIIAQVSIAYDGKKYFLYDDRILLPYDIESAPIVEKIIDLNTDILKEVLDTKKRLKEEDEDIKW